MKNDNGNVIGSCDDCSQKEVRYNETTNSYVPYCTLSQCFVGLGGISLIPISCKLPEGRVC